MTVRFRPFRRGNGEGLWYVSTRLGYHGTVVRTPSRRYVAVGVRGSHRTREAAGRALVAATAERVAIRTATRRKVVAA